MLQIYNLVERQVIQMSDMFTVSNVDWKKLAKGLGIAVGGAVLTYLTEWISGTDFGTLTPTIVAGFSVLVNFLRKFLTATEG